VVSAHRTRKNRADGERYGCCEFRSHAAPPHWDWWLATIATNGRLVQTGKSPKFVTVPKLPDLAGVNRFVRVWSEA
jgi:hypothetical protein